jgi:hypothetical protein
VLIICSFPFSFGLTCPLNLRVLRESAVLMICKCFLFLSLNKITVFPLSFPVVLVDFFWDFNALLFFGYWFGCGRLRYAKW